MTITPRLNEAEKTLLASLPADADVRIGERVASHQTKLSLRTDEGTTVVLAVDAGQGDAAERLRALLLDRIMISAGAEVIRVPAWLCQHNPDEASRAVLKARRALSNADDQPEGADVADHGRRGID